MNFFPLPQLDTIKKMYDIEVVMGEDWSEHYWPRGGNEVVAFHPPIHEQWWNESPNINKYTFDKGVMGINKWVFLCVIF